MFPRFNFIRSFYIFNFYRCRTGFSKLRRCQKTLYDLNVKFAATYLWEIRSFCSRVKFRCTFKTYPAKPEASSASRPTTVLHLSLSQPYALAIKFTLLFQSASNITSNRKKTIQETQTRKKEVDRVDLRVDRWYIALFSGKRRPRGVSKLKVNRIYSMCSCVSNCCCSFSKSIRFFLCDSSRI